MKHLLQILTGNRGKLNPLERYIIDQAADSLAPAARELLYSQIKRINRVQRLIEGKEVDLYQMKGGKAAFDDSLRFPYRNDESLLATIRLAHPSKPEVIQAELWLANGRLFSLLFDKSPRRFFDGIDLSVTSPAIVDKQICIDPMALANAAHDREEYGVKLHSWVRDWFAAGRFTDIVLPLTSSKRDSYRRQVRALLPADYIELTDQIDGARGGDIRVHGLSAIRKIVRAEANYYVLADAEGKGVLAIKENGKDAGIYFINYEDDNAVSFGDSFQRALATLVEYKLPG